ACGLGGSAAGFIYLPEDEAGIGIYDIGRDGGPVWKRKVEGTLGSPSIDPGVIYASIQGNILYGTGQAIDQAIGPDGDFPFVAAWDLQLDPPALFWWDVLSQYPSALATSGDKLLIGKPDALQIRSLTNPRAPIVTAELPLPVGAILAAGDVAWV